ncbi:hypothetical protein [Enterococcus bulliens]
MKKAIGCCILGLSLVGIGITTQVQAEELTYIPIYRMYNPNSGEHFYTKSLDEMTHLTTVGWNSEGVGWVAPFKDYVSVFRLYNKNSGDHHYTQNTFEKTALVSIGWKDEGIAFYSDRYGTVPVYRAYNPFAKVGTHNYTTSGAEQLSLINSGWKNEGLAWYAKESGYPLFTEDKAIQILKDNFTSKNQSLDDLSFVPIKQIGQDYLIRLVVLSMVEQGGSVTAGFYRVSPQGLVQACDANGTPY